MYRANNAKEFFADDLNAIEELRDQIAKLADNERFDRIQKLQA